MKILYLGSFLIANPAQGTPRDWKTTDFDEKNLYESIETSLDPSFRNKMKIPDFGQGIILG